MATNSGNSTQTPQQRPTQPTKSITQLMSQTPPLPTADSKVTGKTKGDAKQSSPSSSDVVVIHVPTYSRWFSWNNIHECEVRMLPEFFDGKSPKTPKVYKYCRNALVKKFRDSMKQNPPTKENPTPKITYTEARKSIIGDVGSIRKVFDFLETWGLINYFGAPSMKGQLKLEDKESKNLPAALQRNSSDPNGTNAVGGAIVAKKRFCSSCKTLCTVSCYVNIKSDTTLCARCYLNRGEESDFNRVTISEEPDWTEKETLSLLQAVLHYQDDWKKVSEHVTGRNEKQCVDRFIKLSFGEQYIGPPNSVFPEENFHKATDPLDIESPPGKKMRPSPFDDASNPIVAQAAFLSTLVGVEVAERAASAAVKTLTEINNETSKEILGSSAGNARDHDSVTENGSKGTMNLLEGAYLEAKSQLDKEEQELERTISDIAEVQAKDIHEKIVRFEELELQMEREWQQLRQMQSMLFADQLSLSFQKKDGTSRNGSMEQNVKAES